MGETKQFRDRYIEYEMPLKLVHEVVKQSWLLFAQQPLLPHKTINWIWCRNHFISTKVFVDYKLWRMCILENISTA